MKKLIYLSTITISLFTLSSCEKEIMSYEGQDGIYFDVRWGSNFRDPDTQWGHQYYTPIEFGNMTETSHTAQIRVTASGTIKDYDRPFTITIGKDSTNAIEGKDYEPFPMEYILKAGERYAYIDVTFNRTERMRTDTVTLQLQLQPNQYFTCPFTNYADNPMFDNPETTYGYNPDATVHKIVVTDMMTQPAGWWGSDSQLAPGLFGKWSQTKWLLLMEITGTTVEDYASRQATDLPSGEITMPMTRAQVLSEQFARYLLEQAEKGREYAVIDEDGTMMYCSYVSTLNPSAWSVGTRPEDYYRTENN